MSVKSSTEISVQKEKFCKLAHKIDTTKHGIIKKTFYAQSRPISCGQAT